MNPAAIHLLEKNLEKIDWLSLSLNTSAIHLLEKNPEKIDWDWLSRNPAAIHLLEKNPEKMNWYWLSGIQGVIHLFESEAHRVAREKNPEKIWEKLSRNPAIFKSSKNDIYKFLYRIQNWIYKLDLL